MKRKVVLCIFLIFSLTASFLYAQDDNSDLSLFAIDRLIRKTEYDEALRQLNNYIKIHPDNFDNAQSRIKRIMNARKEYSILAEKLIDLIQTDPGNNKEIYEITAQLEKFEKHPSDQNLQFIADLKKSAEFNYFRALFLEIQTETAKNTQQGKYVAAIEKAREGFWLYKDSFDDRWEDVPEISSPVAEILQDLNNQIAVYEEKNFIPRINDAVNDFVKSVNLEQYDQALEKLTVVQRSMQQYSSVRNAIVKDGLKLQNMFAEVQKIDEDTTDASFLPFMFRFVYGVDSVPDSGIIGAIDAQWNEMEGRMNSAVYTVLSKNYRKFIANMNDSNAEPIKKYIALNQKVLDLYKIPNESIEKENPDRRMINPYEDYYTRSDYLKNLADESLRLGKVWNQVQKTAAEQKTVLEQLNNQDSAINTTVSVNTLFDANTNLVSLIGIRETQELRNKTWALEYNELNVSDWAELTSYYETTLADVFTKAGELSGGLWLEICNYYRKNSDAFYDSILAYNNSSVSYTNGFFTKIPQNVLIDLNMDISRAVEYEKTFNQDPELDFGINYSYPNLAIRILEYNSKLIDNDYETLTVSQNLIRTNYSKSEQWSSDVELSSMVEETIQYLETRKQEILGLRTFIKNQQTVAQNKIIASQLARNEADIRFSEAQNALRSENFETARKKLQDALTKYDEALNNLNDELLRTECDTKLQELGERIAKGENEIVVREVRDLKTLAKDAYFNGRFDDAEKYLNQAKTRWAVTNTSEDEEIANLMNFVNTAISMKDGREILPSAPQYPEMSQLLNVSYQYFDEGSRKIGEGNRTEGLADLDLALESIQKLQYVYPLNQEAALLTLRISRLKDPKKFADEFSQRIQSAKMMCKSRETQQQGYANLLDYYELAPDYKGLKELIYQTEIDIGIRQKPVDNSGANKAKKLLADAQSIYKSAGNDENKLKSALAKIDQALALVSDNKTAIALKDEITTKIGGNTATVLSTEDERLYQLAIQRLQNNNVVGANAIVDQLLKKPSNGNSQKIKDLKNKIDARS